MLGKSHLPTVQDVMATATPGLQLPVNSEPQEPMTVYVHGSFRQLPSQQLQVDAGGFMTVD